jgi:hypothetical protein
MVVFWEMPALNSGVIAKQIKRDSTIQAIPRTVRFFRKFIK